MTIFAESFFWGPGFPALIIVVLAVILITRQAEVRIVLLGSAVLLGLLAGKLDKVVQVFFASLADESFVIPLISALGFSYVVRHTECDQHLIHLLLEPIRRVRWLLVPGTVVVGYLVNMPIVSQTGTAATLGPVVLPLAKAAGVSTWTSGAALVLGSSIGGELFNPGAPEYATIVEESRKAYMATGNEPTFTTDQCVRQTVPWSVLCLIISTLVFWWFSRGEPVTSAFEDLSKQVFAVDFRMAMVPLVPLVLLYISAPPFELITIPTEWLVAAGQEKRFEARLIGAAMLVGCLVAALVVPKKAGTLANAFFKGAGYSYANVVSLIVTAKCFGAAVGYIGLTEGLGHFGEGYPHLLIPLAGLLCMAFAALCGSGIAATQSMFGFFVGPAIAVGIDPIELGAVVAVSSAAGRTMSPVAAVVLVTSKMTELSPLEICRRLTLPILIALGTVLLVSQLLPR